MNPNTRDIPPRMKATGNPVNNSNARVRNMIAGRDSATNVIGPSVRFSWVRDLHG